MLQAKTYLKPTKDKHLLALAKKIDKHVAKTNSLRADWIRLDLNQLVYDDWHQYIKDLEGTYVRNVVYRSDFIELIIIIWSGHSQTPVHDHASGGCWIKVLSGIIQEKRYDLSLAPTKTTIIKQDGMCYIDNSIGYHKIINSENVPVCSLHLYAPPDYKPNCWPEDTL